MIVVDSSAFTEMLVFEHTRGRRAREVLGRDPGWCAPEHWKTEVFSSIRGLTIGGHLDESTAAVAVDRIPALAVDHVSLDQLLGTMWGLRHEVSGYDAAYVALAARRRLTLVTADARLARTVTRHCRIELLA